MQRSLSRLRMSAQLRGVALRGVALRRVARRGAAV